MQQVINIGSLNIDDVFRVERFVRPGETMDTTTYHREFGGKGLNQSIALVRAGASVDHVGCIGNDGLFLKDYLSQAGVDVKHVSVIETPTGRAIIQVCHGDGHHGENSIILFGGANKQLTDQVIESALRQYQAGDFLLLQNETSGVAAAMHVAHKRGLKIAYNPAPCTQETAQTVPLHLVDYLVLNEDEIGKLCGEFAPVDALLLLRKKAPNALLCLTLGSAGSLMLEPSGRLTEQPAYKTQVVDTTAAGDTMVGYLLAGISADRNPVSCLREATIASTLCVSRPGAAASIPNRSDVLRFAQENKIVM